MDDFSAKLNAEIYSYWDKLIEVLPALGVGVILFLFFLMAGSIGQRWLRKNLKSDDILLNRFLARAFKFLLVLVGLLVLMRSVGLKGAATGLLTSAGLGAFILGFAFKDIIENFLAGIILAFNRPFRVGDRVALDGAEGVVVTINLRETQLKSFDGRDIYIPNARVLKNHVINYTIDGFLRFSLTFGLDYGSDVEQAKSTILKIVQQTEGVLKDGEHDPLVYISDMGESTLNLTVNYWIDTFDKSVSNFKIKTHIIDTVLKVLVEEGFNLPGRVVEIKNYDSEGVRYIAQSS